MATPSLINIPGSHLDVFRQLCAGHVCDGDLASKASRDRLVKEGWACRGAGFNLLTAEGARIADALGLLSTHRPAEAVSTPEPSFRVQEAIIRNLLAPQISREYHHGSGCVERSYQEQSIRVPEHTYHAFDLQYRFVLPGVLAVLMRKESGYNRGFRLVFAFHDAVEP